MEGNLIAYGRVFLSPNVVGKAREVTADRVCAVGAPEDLWAVSNSFSYGLACSSFELLFLKLVYCQISIWLLSAFQEHL